MNLSLHRVITVIEIVTILISAYSVWQKILLPYSYLFAAVILGVLLAISIVKNNDNEKASKYVVLQIFLLFLFIRNIYYLSTQNTIPFGDAHWDYAVGKTFAQENRIFLIHSTVHPVEAGRYSELTWYSGWPLLYSLGLTFCRITGMDPFYLNLTIPSLFGFVSLILVYLLVERLRIKLHFSREVTFLALLIYAIAPEAIFWQMQFTRQSFAIVLFTLMVYLVCVSFSYKLDRRYGAILVVLALLVVTAHHFTSFTAVLFLVLLSAFVTLGKYFGKIKTLSRLFWSSPKVSFLGIALAMSIFMFIWWDSLGMVIWSTAESRISRFVEVWKGMQFQLWAPTTAYPGALRPAWVPPLLRLRDFIMYVPAFFGLLIMWHKRTKIPEKFFVIYSPLAFGLIFFLDNVFFALEPFRVILLSMPLVAFLSSLFYNKTRDFSSLAWKATIFIVIILLVVSSFVGLWAHDFAPIHLYDSSINPGEIGEVTPSFIRLKPFFEHKIAIDNLQTVRSDVICRWVYLLNPNEYDKIRKLPTKNLQQLREEGNTLICSFNNLNMYLYFGYIWRPVHTLEEAETVQYELRGYLNGNFNRIYDDERNILWTTSKTTS